MSKTSDSIIVDTSIMIEGKLKTIQLMARKFMGDHTEPHLDIEISNRIELMNGRSEALL
jgi:hypothetical protein